MLIVLAARIKDPEKRSAPMLLLGVAPLVVVNTTRMDNTRAGGGGTGDDWLQILHSVPFLLHAFALSLASRRWSRLGRQRRAAFLLTLALVIVPVAAAAARYSLLLLRNPESGYEFVDNRSLAEALVVIPQNFTRDDRQMQIPALFGHQELLERPEWSDAIPEAARTHHWTHLLIRKDYVHPAPIPLEQIFENQFYAVFRFP